MGDRAIIGLAGLAMLAASQGISRGEELQPFPVSKPKPPRKTQSDSLKRMLRKARS